MRLNEITFNFIERDCKVVPFLHISSDAARLMELSEYLVLHEIADNIAERMSKERRETNERIRVFREAQKLADGGDRRD